MGRFDYPSPYWDSVGDPALDLIDRMLTVDNNKRITIDECLEHPWITMKGLNVPKPGPGDSTDGLTGAMDQLNTDFSKRKVERERTLLSHINSVKISKVIEWEDNKADVKVFAKNPDGKRHHNTQGKGAAANIQNGAETQNNGMGATQMETQHLNGEEAPAAHQQADAFMQMGGKGDQQLFTNDGESRYHAGEIP